MNRLMLVVALLFIVTPSYGQQLRNQALTVVWDDNSDNESYFPVYAKTPTGLYNQVGTAPSSPDTTTITGKKVSYNIIVSAVEGQLVTFAVAAAIDYVDSAGVKQTLISDKSNDASVTIPSTLPVAPTGVSLVPLSNSALRFTWSDNADNESGYEVQGRRATGQPYSTLGKTSANGTTFDWTRLLSYKGYCMRVRAFNSAGSGAWSSEVCATTNK